jgi:hypothetical protein
MDEREFLPFPLENLTQLIKRPEKVTLDVVVEGSEGGDVENTCLAGRPSTCD